MLQSKFKFGNEKGLASVWKSFQVPRNEKNFNLGTNKAQRGVLLIQSVATLEPRCLVQSNGGQDGRGNPQLRVDSGSASGIQNQSSSEDSEELSEKEKLRRMRISAARKGLSFTPWNKGRKLSAETRQRIKERTLFGMQNPKVREKLANRGHAQSKETRKKIGAGVQMGWERRREKLRLQETCYFDWQNLIAEASRRGFVGQEELRWDSYKMLSEQLEQEWLESNELRKHTRRLKGKKKAPKSLEQRNKISEAITSR